MPSRNERRANDRWISIAASTAARGDSNTAKNSSARASTSRPPNSATVVRSAPRSRSMSGANSSPSFPTSAVEPSTSVISIVTNPLGSSSRRTPRPLTGIDLAGDETDRHDAVALCSPQQACTSTVTRRVVLELDLAEPGQRVAHVRRVVDREPPVALRIDVGERSIRERSPVGRRQPRHATHRNGTGVDDGQPLLRCATRKPPLPNSIVRLPIWIVPLRFVPVREVSVADEGSGSLRSASTTC